MVDPAASNRAAASAPAAGDTPAPPAAATPDESALLARLRAGEEAAFVGLVERHQASMLRVARIHCPRRDAAEEVVQETWLAVFEGIGRFEGRSTLRTWIYSILTNRAKTRGIRERRFVPLSALAASAAPGAESEEEGPTVDPARFQPAGRPWAGHWTSPPRAWTETPGDPLLAEELSSRIRAAIETLPDRQREVITLRDVEGLSSEDVRNVLGLSETNQRVILHRARAKVRRALERYFDEAPSA
jgi:RNA polymerase sigma-70 factor (ECF subfamily)